MRQQLAIIAPTVVVLLGRVATQGVLGESVPLAREHGHVLDRDGRMYVSMYHPAATLHNPAVTSDFVADCEALQRLLSDKHMLQGPRPRRVAGFLIAAVPASRGHGERQFFHT